MKVDDQPFPQNMISFSVNMTSASDPKGKGKTKVLTSDRAKKSGAVDPDRQVSREEMQQRVQF
jgi:hypothetical protein